MNDGTMRHDHTIGIPRLDRLSLLHIIACKEPTDRLSQLCFHLLRNALRDRFKEENVIVLNEEPVGVITEQTSRPNLQADYVVVVP